MLDFAGPTTLKISGVTDIFFFQAEDGIRDLYVTGVQTCALPIWTDAAALRRPGDHRADRARVADPAGREERADGDGQRRHAGPRRAERPDQRPQDQRRPRRAQGSDADHQARLRRCRLARTAGERELEAQAGAARPSLSAQASPMDKKNEGEGSKTADKKYREAAT